MIEQNKQQVEEVTSAAQAAKEEIAKPRGSVRKGTDEQFDRLGSEPVGKLLKEFAIPAIVSMVVGGLYNLFTAIFLGQGMGDLGLAISTVANPMMILFMSMAMLIGTGGNALAAIKLGEGKKREAERVLGNTFTLSIFGGVLLILISFIFIEPILDISGANAETRDLSRTFIQILACGSVMQLVGMGLNNFIRSAGDPARALWSMLSGSVVCIAFSFLLVIVLQCGIIGQAIAVLAGQGITMIVVLYYFIFSKKSPFKLKACNLSFIDRTPLTILALGSAAFLLQIAVCIVNFVINNQISIYGDISSIGQTGAFAMLAVIQRISMFVMFPVMGITVAAQPILGYCYGARIPRRVKDTLKLEFKWALIFCIIMWIILEVFSSYVCVLFGIEGELLEYTQLALRIQTIAMPLMVAQIVIANCFQATGRPMRSAFLSLTRQIIYLIPLYIAMPIFVANFIPTIEPLLGVLMAPPIADVLSCLTALVFIVKEFKSLNLAIKQMDAGEPCDWGSNNLSETAKPKEA